MLMMGSILVKFNSSKIVTTSWVLMRLIMCSNSTSLVDSDFLGCNNCSRLEDNSKWGRSAMVVADDLLLMLDYLDQKMSKSLKVIE